MINWELIDNYLLKLEKYRNRKEWDVFFNSIDNIKEAEKNKHLEFQSFFIKYNISILKLEEKEYIQLTDKNDFDGKNAISNIILFICLTNY